MGMHELAALLEFSEHSLQHSLSLPVMSFLPLLITPLDDGKSIPFLTSHTGEACQKNSLLIPFSEQECGICIARTWKVVEIYTAITLRLILQFSPRVVVPPSDVDEAVPGVLSAEAAAPASAEDTPSSTEARASAIASATTLATASDTVWINRTEPNRISNLPLAVFLAGAQDWNIVTIGLKWDAICAPK